MNNICSPHINNNSGSCLQLEYLHEIIDEYNKKYPENKISKSGNKKDLWKRINNTMKNHCPKGNEICWVKKFHSKKDYVISEVFKPKIPEGKYQWLSTLDIDNVMKQYMKKYPNFVFIGAIPRDFFNIIHKIGIQNLTHLSKKAEKIGLIFNTDPHDKSGKHWLAIFIDIKERSIEHFDSVGKLPIQEIAEFLSQICKNAYMNLNIRLKKKINIIQHQHENSECGVYSCYYIIQRLKGRTFEDITENVVPDEKMNKFRKKIFTKHD